VTVLVAEDFRDDDDDGLALGDGLVAWVDVGVGGVECVAGGESEPGGVDVVEGVDVGGIGGCSKWTCFGGEMLHLR
jgi:hypothetical protein